MSHPRVEEVSDSDPEMGASDPEEGDIDDFVDTDIMRRMEPASSAARQNQGQGARAQSHILDPRAVASAGVHPPAPMSSISADEQAAYRGFQSLYPVYFDAGRSRAEGRRVPRSLAVRSPLAREIANACSRLRLQTLLEPDKLHPKDWANPGRVKVGLKKAGAGGAHGINNKHHLYLVVARHLREHPTTDDSPGLRVRVGGQLQPPEGAAYPRPAVPRGWKMGEHLPYLSAAMTGGGVSENLFKDMMKEMQSGGDPMAALMAGQQAAAGADDAPAGKKKKDKKGKGKA